MAEFIFGDSKITADGDCSHEIKKTLAGRKVMTNLDSILKSTQVERDQGPVAAVQRRQSLTQELRPVVVDVVVPQRQMRDPGQREGERGSRETWDPGRFGNLGKLGGMRRAIRV